MELTMVIRLAPTQSSTNLSYAALASPQEPSTAALAAPLTFPSDVGEALALFMVKLGREQRDAARALRASAEAAVRAAQADQLHAMRSQARAELAGGLAGAMGSFAEAGVNLRSATIKQSVADRPVPVLGASRARAQDPTAPKLDRLKAISAGVAGATRVFEAGFGALASNAKISTAQSERRASELSQRVDTLRADEREAQAFINAGLDALKAYGQRVHETRTAAIFR
jgi:hypothetical protein